MAIDYDFYDSSNLRGVKHSVYAKPVGGQLVDTDRLAGFIEKGTSASRADILLVLSALADEMGYQMKEGNRVKLDGLGTFSISMGGKIDKDRNGKLLLKDAHVRGIRFKPAASLMGKLYGADFTRQRHRGMHSANVDEQAVREAAMRLTEGGGAFITREFRYELGLTLHMAYKWLRRLVADGTLRKTGTRKCDVYVRGNGTIGGDKQSE